MTEETPRQLYGVIDNYDSNGTPAGALGPAGFVITQDRYKNLRGKLLRALQEAYGKFSHDYYLKHHSKPTYARVRECAVDAFNDFLATVPQVEPTTLPEMLDSI
jgi:hypothetical protein